MFGIALTQRNTLRPLDLLDVVPAAQHALNWALEMCAKMMGLDGPGSAARCVQEGNATARLYCCSGLTRQMAEFLGSSDKNIKAIYAPEQDGFGEGHCEEPMVRLLVWTQCKTHAFDMLVTSWERALCQACQDTIGLPHSTRLVDVQVMDDAYVARHLSSSRNKCAAARLAACMMRATNEVPDIVYERESTLAG